MWPFKRSKKNPTAPVAPEVQAYYQAEKRERVGIAWLIAFVSLIISVAVVAGLFFGGRWAYRKLAHKTSGYTTQTVAKKSSSKTKAGGESSTTTPSATSNSGSSSSTTPPATTTPPPSTTNTNPALVNTGPTPGDDN